MCHHLEREMEELDVPSIPEFVEIDTGSGLHGCQGSCDLFELTIDNRTEQVKAVIKVGEFYERAAGSAIIFT